MNELDINVAYGAQKCLFHSQNTQNPGSIIVTSMWVSKDFKNKKKEKSQASNLRKCLTSHVYTKKKVVVAEVQQVQLDFQMEYQL